MFLNPGKVLRFTDIGGKSFLYRIADGEKDCWGLFVMNVEKDCGTHNVLQSMLFLEAQPCLLEHLKTMNPLEKHDDVCFGLWSSREGDEIAIPVAGIP